MVPVRFTLKTDCRHILKLGFSCGDSSRSAMQDRNRLPKAEEAELTPQEQDIDLMLRVKRDDMDAFQELVETHQAKVVGTIAKMLGNESEAEDIAQQVFIRIWKARARYKPTAKFTTWLFKITRNLVFNEVRRRKRHPAERLEREVGDHAPELEDHTTVAPDSSLLEAELQDAIQEAIDSLPATQRMAVILRRYDELSYEEIGEVLTLTVPAVKSVLFRARTELRKKLQRYLDR